MTSFLGGEEGWLSTSVFKMFLLVFLSALTKPQASLRHLTLRLLRLPLLQPEYDSIMSHKASCSGRVVLGVVMNGKDGAFVRRGLVGAA